MQEMNLLNLERCRCIPKDLPGADWRVLLELVAKDPSRELFQVRSAAGLPEQCCIAADDRPSAAWPLSSACPGSPRLPQCSSLDVLRSTTAACAGKGQG